MSLPVQQLISYYVGNGVTTIFPFLCRIWHSSDLVVTSNGSVVSANAYTITGVGEATGGYITFATPPGTGAAIAIARKLSPIRETEYIHAGDFRAATVNSDQDYQTALIQQTDADLTATETQLRSEIYGLGLAVSVVDLGLVDNLEAAVAAFGAAHGTITIATSQTLTGPLTLHENLVLRAIKPAIITVPNGATLTINSPFECGLYQVFNCVGTGSVVVNMTHARPEWWGETVADNGTYSGPVQTDAGVCWLQHNFPEEANDGSDQVITYGNIPKAPLFEGTKQSHTNVLAHWYQDFGLEYTRAVSTSWKGWYYWQWLFHGATGDGYEAEREPWLGYFRGDDATVLDWHCYWLNEAGVTGVIPVSRGNADAIRTTWATPSDKNHWLYQLLNNAPNFKRLTYALWADSSTSAATTDNKNYIEGSFDEIIGIYGQYNNYAYMEKNGGIYPIIYVYEGENWRGAYDSYSGYTNTRAFLAAQAVKFQSAGWSGFCVISRNSTYNFCGDQALEADGVIYLDSEYSCVASYEPANNGGLTTPTTYEHLAIGMGTRNISSTIPYRYTVPAVMTAAKSHSAHSSTWDWPGSTPELFEQMVRNVLRRSSANGNPQLLTIYNVSEWAEAGPSLHPNMRDGKGYLIALKNALDARQAELPTMRSLYIKGAIQTLTTPSVPIVPGEDEETVTIETTYAWTSTATPVIQDPNPYDGKRIRLRLSHDSYSIGPITLEDITIRATSGLMLTSGTIALSKNDSVEFEYNATLGVWIQSSIVVNIIPNTPAMPVYADNAAATTAGLTAGTMYRTSTGQVMVRY